MVIVEERRRLASGLRRFASGRMTVDEFEALAEGMRDAAAEAFFLHAWSHYDDFRTERLVGEWRLDPEARRRWARWALYLATDEAPYPWAAPPLVDWAAILPFGFVLRRRFGWPPEPDYASAGYGAKNWPFRDRAHRRESERLYLARHGF